jgi:hypothetical protein
MVGSGSGIKYPGSTTLTQTTDRNLVDTLKFSCLVPNQKQFSILGFRNKEKFLKKETNKMLFATIN